ncbi:ribulose-phosphate 3-epimerase [Arsenicitalea aurantiaca]|uniref:Ribulose-phosphate 3-epimerase n=1 Tax=Arsenicitalea aurantiaca TaxID=1783274 RepID=A0A433XB88_9HYPH|nr:ribulose-phosphate 3-epimerase [Arsenicitalea aurantiaca]RUT31357.1 ribulose-phosphate 3-epimerase [Arsenicitalea aurantiaca]
MTRPPENWLERLDRSRLVAEFSMWSADLGNLVAACEAIEPYADILHLDVADGHFAPALLFFPDLVARLRRATRKPLHVHLMVDDAVLLSQVEQFAEAGTDLISIHLENAAVADRALARIAELGLAAGMVLRVETALEGVAAYLDRIDMLTLLGTAIGVKGQGLDRSAKARLEAARGLIAASGRPVLLAADGGIRDTTVPLLRAAGAQTVVLGSLAFGAPDLGARMAWLRDLG